MKRQRPRLPMSEYGEAVTLLDQGPCMFVSVHMGQGQFI